MDVTLVAFPLIIWKFIGSTPHFIKIVFININILMHQHRHKHECINININLTSTLYMYVTDNSIIRFNIVIITALFIPRK